MPRIVAYHPEILVEKADKEVVAIRADLDDWYSDEEVLAQLARETGARTVGEAVTAVEEDLVKKSRSSNGLDSARIIKVQDKKGRPVRKWDENIKK